MSQDQSTLLALFQEAAWEVDQKRFDDLRLDARISEMGIDSVAMLEVIGFLEEELDIHLPDEEIAGVKTLQDLADVIHRVDKDALDRFAADA